MSIGPDARPKPTSCIVHYEYDEHNEDGEHASTRQEWSRPYLPSIQRRKQDSLKVFFPNSSLSRSWDESLATPHRYSSNKSPLSSSANATKDVSSWPFSTQVKLRNEQVFKRSVRTPPGTTAVSSPSLHTLGTGHGDTSLTNSAETLVDPSWNYYMNAWVSSKLGHSNTYITFAGTTELIDRGISHYLPEFHEFPILPCPRYLEHMHKTPVLKPIPTGRVKKVLEKPKFWKWKGRKDPVVSKSKPVEEKVSTRSLPLLPSLPEESISKSARSSSLSQFSSSTSLLTLTSYPSPTPPAISPFITPRTTPLSNSPHTELTIDQPDSFSPDTPFPTPHFASYPNIKRCRSLSPVETEQINIQSRSKTPHVPHIPQTTLLTPVFTPRSLSPQSSPLSGFPSPSLFPSACSLTPQSRMSPEMKRGSLEEEGKIDLNTKEGLIEIPRKFEDDHPDDGPLDDHEEYSDYGSLRSGDVDNRSSVSKAASVSLTSGIDEFSDSDSQLAPLFQTSSGDKPPIEFYHLTDPPKTASSMDWEMAGTLADTESGSEDDIVLGVSPSKLKRMFFSNDYIEVVEVPTFGQVDYVSFDLYKCVELLPGLEFSAEQNVDIQPPDQLIVEDCTRVTLHSPPPKAVPVPKVPSLPPPPPPPPPPEPEQLPPPKDPTPPPHPVSKPKRKPIVKKTKTVPKAKKKTKPTKEDAIPRTMPPEPLSSGSGGNGVDSLPDVLEEEEPVAPPEPSPPIPPKVVPPAPKKEKPKPRPAPPRITSPSTSIELESIQEEIEYETDDFQSDNLSTETPPPLKNETSILDQSHVELKTTPTVPPDKKTPPLPLKVPPPPVLNIEPPESVSPPQEEDDGKESQEALLEKTPLPPPVKDAAFLAEQERERLAEERRLKAYDMFERLKSKRFLPVNASKKPSFKDEGWLAQFFIIKEDKAKMYQQVFNTVDEDKDGYLNCFETLMALKGISGAQKLTEKEEAYIVRVLELAEYSISQGTDLRLFSVLAALSQRIASIDTWVRNMINSVDLTTLEWKITKGKELFEWCIDEDTRLLQLDRFLVELKAGGVSQNHQEEVELTLGSKGSWDLIDFLSYLPLFIMTHESVVNNPLDDSREK